MTDWAKEGEFAGWKFASDRAEKERAWQHRRAESLLASLKKLSIWLGRDENYTWEERFKQMQDFAEEVVTEDKKRFESHARGEE